jgi:hypothetical protein
MSFLPLKSALRELKAGGLTGKEAKEAIRWHVRSGHLARLPGGVYQATPEFFAWFKQWKEGPGVDERAMLVTVNDLVKLFGLDRGKEALRKRLERWRKQNVGSPDWQEVRDRGSRQPLYFYRLSAIRHLVEGLSAKRPPGGFPTP